MKTYLINVAFDMVDLTNGTSDHAAVLRRVEAHFTDAVKAFATSPSVAVGRAGFSLFDTTPEPDAGGSAQ